MATKKSGSRQERSDERVGRDRENDDRAITDDREMTDVRRLEEFRAQFFQSALPDLPKIPGYHVCWLTTTDPRDPIHGRIRIGYEPIRGSDIPGWEHSTLKGGDYQGVVGVNEMIAAKIRTELYEMYMAENHHNSPLREEEKLRTAMNLVDDQLRQKGARLVIEEGSASLAKNLGVPRFSDAVGEGPVSEGS